MRAIQKIKLSYPLLFLSILLFAVDERGTFLLILVAAFWHELGHLAAIKLSGAQVDSIYGGVTGMKITYHAAKQLSYRCDMLLALAGPAANLLAVAVCSLLAKWVQDELLFYFIGINLLLGLFNLLPVLPLDGGRALHALLAWVWEPERAERVMKTVTTVLGVLLVLLGAWLLAVSRKNGSLLLVALFILVASSDKITLHHGVKKL